MDNYYDVIIIGAGPAGTASAISLAKASNLKILLVDKMSFPRDKICGDGLTGDSIRCLKELEIWDKIKNQGNSMDRIKLYPFNDSSYFTINSEIVTLPRKELDEILLKEALKSNNTSLKEAIFHGQIKEKNDMYQTIFTDSTSSKEIILSSKFVIIATGCQNDRPLYTMRRLSYRQPDLVAVRGYYYAKWNLSEPIVIFLDSSKRGYFWAFPMGHNLFNVGCGIKTNQKVKPELKKILMSNIETLNQKNKTHGEWKIEPKGAFLRSGLTNYDKLSYDNVIFTGETISSTYQFTGEGIGKALETGILSSKSILLSLNRKNKKATFYYNNSIAKQISPKYKPYRIADYIFTNKHISTFFFNLLCKSQRAQQFISDVLSEKIAPAKLFILKSFIKLIFYRNKFR